MKPLFFLLVWFYSTSSKLKIGTINHPKRSTRLTSGKTGHERRTASSVILLLSLPATDDDGVHGKITTICKEAAYYTHLAQEASTKAAIAKPVSSEDDQLTKVWQLKAAQTPPSETKSFLTALTAYASFQSASRLTNADIAARKASELATVAGIRSGYLTGWEHSSELLAATVKAPKTAARSATVCTVEYTGATAEYTSCNYMDPQTISDQHAELNWWTTTKLHFSSTAALKALSSAVKAKATTATNGIGSNGQAGQKCTTSNNDVNEVTPAIEITSAKTVTAAPTEIMEETDGAKQCKTKPRENEQEPMQAKLNRLLCETQQAIQRIPAALSSTSSSQLKADNIMLEAANNLIMGDAAVEDPTSGTGKATVAKRIEELIGDDSKFKENFIENLKKERVTFKKAGKTSEEKSLEDIAKSDDFGIALSYFEGQSMLAVADAAKKAFKPQITETEKTCNAKGENECKPPCKLVDEEGGKKKCKLSEEEAKKVADETAKDGKTETTNTTESNSFLIKAPLLLTFFH
uniref:Variant surface glycoprotein 1125.4078 n=1 Tax=Trypanosoma brucei TaxID=5691 RepID=A0A1J0R9U6_9TRYP|nr:variant surface glycoprotein 1125.4078 [Trypanosoma brucei]